MSIYQKDYTIRSCDVDLYRRLRLSVLFTMLQEAAIAHTRQLGAGREKTLDKGLLWIVTGQSAKIRRLPEYDEAVTLLSWPGKTMHLFFPRYFEMLDASGESILKAGSLWALIDEKSRKMIFPEEHDISIEEEKNKPEDMLPRRFKSVTLTQTSRFTVPFSCVDLNGHMNNTRYYDLTADLMPDKLLEKTPSEIQAEYTGEASLSETLSLNFGEYDSAFYLSAKSARPLFSLRIKF